MVKKLINKTPKVVQSALSNKYVLYLVLLFSIAHVVGYIQMGSWDALALYMAGVVVMRYFSKNMIVNTLVALNVANCKVCADYLNVKLEGFKEGAKNIDGTTKKNSKYYKNKAGNCVEHTEQSKKNGGCKGKGCKKNCKTCYGSIKCT